MSEEKNRLRIEIPGKLKADIIGLWPIVLTLSAGLAAYVAALWASSTGV